MLVALDFVEQENRTVTDGEFLHGAGQRNPIHGRGEATVNLSMLALRGPRFLVRGFIKRHLTQSFLAKMHQNGVHGHSVQPGG